MISAEKTVLYYNVNYKKTKISVLPFPIPGVNLCCELGVEVDGDVEEFEVDGKVAAAASKAASFSNFFMRASCWRSDIGVWLGTEDMPFADVVNDVGDDPLLFRNLKILIKF